MTSPPRPGHDLAACLLPSGEPYRLMMGLRPLNLEQWLERDRRRPEIMARKAVLLAHRHADVVAHRPEAETASREVLGLVLTHAQRHWPGQYRVDGDRVTDVQTRHCTNVGSLDPIDSAGRLVQEDLCVMIESTSGWVLGAASVCFPSRWSLTAKMGTTLRAIHDPVPGYPDRLAATVDNFFDRCRADRPVWRLNWTILDDPDLFQPRAVPSSRADTASADDSPPRSDTGSSEERDRGPEPTGNHRSKGPPRTGAADALYVRIERQTLRRLPVTGAVLFTIGTTVAPLADVVDGHPDLARNLAATLRTVPAATIDYKGWGPLLGPTLDWLASLDKAPG
jgi:hypothetical protein